MAREHARYLAWKKKMSSVPAVREQCAKKKEIIDHGLEYFEKRIHELGIVVDEKSGQPNNWSLVFRACRDTKAELERVFGVDLERVELPKSKGDIFTFRLKRHVNLSPCNGGKLLILDTRFPDKLAWEKMSLHDSKTIAMNIKSAERQKNDLVKSWATIWRKWLLKGDILLFGPQDTSEYSNPASVAAIMKIFGQKMTPEEKFATLLAAGIGAINYRYIKNKSFLDFRSNETLIMIVLASQGNYKYDR